MSSHTHFTLTTHFSLFFQLSLIEMNTDDNCDEEIHLLLEPTILDYTLRVEE